LSVLVVVALAIALASGWHDAFRNALADLRFHWLKRKAGGDIVVVAIDAPSIEKVGVWPWPRRFHAELVRELERAGVRDIAFKNGEVFAVEACFSGWQGTDGYQYGVVLRDISVREREAERIRYLAEHDALTGLANRNTLHDRLEAMIAAAEAPAGKVVLLVLGLDGFQQVNDMLGHSFGDQVLCAVSERLTQEAGPRAAVARLSGDEFVIAIPREALAGTVTHFAERVARAFDAPLPASVREHRVKVSVGAAVYPEAGSKADELLGNAHLAFFRAKATRRGGVVLFENAIRQEVEARLTPEAELVRAAEREEFELFF
jgi:diguanylate cyclase (GGDEF)-like protein